MAVSSDHVWEHPLTDSGSGSQNKQSLSCCSVAQLSCSAQLLSRPKGKVNGRRRRRQTHSPDPLSRPTPLLRFIILTTRWSGRHFCVPAFQNHACCCIAPPLEQRALSGQADRRTGGQADRRTLARLRASKPAKPAFVTHHRPRDIVSLTFSFRSHNPTIIR